MYKKYYLVILIILIGWVGSALWELTRMTPPLETVIIPSEEEIAANLKKEKLACIAELPLETRLGQKLMPAGFASHLAEQTVALAAHSIGGVIIMDETSGEIITAFRKAMPITPFVAVDQEGGTVQRYVEWGRHAGAEEMALHHSPTSAYEFYLFDSSRLREFGITTNFAPVVDVSSRVPNPLPGRMYGGDPEVVIRYAAAHITAAEGAGITPVIKHFPGLGSATGNTDFTPATIDPLPNLWQRDLMPYQRLAYLKPDVMVGNMIVPGLTDGQPAIWSPIAIDLLRSLGYEDAVVYSDSLTAEAISGSIKEAVLKTWLAGIDVAVIVQAETETPQLASYLEDIIRFASESNALAATELNASVLRIFERKQINPCELPL